MSGRQWEVAVIGGGPAGIAAAAAAAEAGRRTILIDESPRPGGQIWRHQEGASPAAASRWLERLRRSGAVVLSAATVVDVERVAVGGYERVRLTVETASGGAAVEADRLVLAMGARERFFPFPGWTLPGVVGVGGAQALLKSGVSFAGKRVVIAGSGPLLLPVSAALAGAGARVLLIVEQAPWRRVASFAGGLWRQPSKLIEASRYRVAARQAPYRTGSWVVRALGATSVEGVEVSLQGRSRTLACDLLCTGFGLVPNLALARLLGCSIEDGTVRVDALQQTSREGVWCAGEGTGVAGVEAALAEGCIAGAAAADRPDLAAPHLRERDRARVFAGRLREVFAPRSEVLALAGEGTIVCRCEDVARGTLRREWTGRQAKLYTRIGMGPCQGRVCGPIVESLFGWDLESGRAPVSVSSMETLARAGDE